MVVTVGRGFCAKLEEDLTEAEVPLELELSVEGEGDYLFACLGLDSEGRLYGDDYVIWEEHPAANTITVDMIKADKILFINRCLFSFSYYPLTGDFTLPLLSLKNIQFFKLRNCSDSFLL